MKNIVWKLFEQTGNPAYYVLYKELTKDGHHNKGAGSSSNRLQGK
ncbi:MAG: YqzL family protein [Clostridia bacterium]|nr:YqzL family protein [Clostridia bacterium]MBR2966845.1 YqzL family protein [Clostridia bacterium]